MCYQHRFQAMGTWCELQFYAAHPAQAQTLIQQALSEVQRLEAKYSRYRPDSFLSTINRCAAQATSLTVDTETASLLDYAATCYNQSAGLFDITSGVLRRAWRFDSGCLPKQTQLDDLLTRVGWHKIQWRNPELKFTQPGMELDFGGIVKEYAADRIANLCWQQGVQHGLINLGGDIKLIGPQPDGSPWRIAICDPRQPKAILHTVALMQGALASSGDYERAITLNGVRYGHILNPHTGWPVQHLTAVSVIADFCVLAGSAATIAMLKGQGGGTWLKQLGLPHCWVDVQGNIGGSLRG